MGSSHCLYLGIPSLPQCTSHTNPRVHQCVENLAKIFTTSYTGTANLPSRSREYHFLLLAISLAATRLMSLITGLFLADSLHTSHSHSVQFVSMRPRQSDSSVPHFPYSTPACPSGAAVILFFAGVLRIPCCVLCCSQTFLSCWLYK